MMRRIVIIIFGLCFVIGLTGWLRARSSSPSNALWEQVQRGPGVVVDFAELFPFAWDRVYVFNPYTPAEEITKRLGFSWSGATKTAISESKGLTLVVFVRDRDVVHSFEHSRGRGDMVALGNEIKGFARDQAKFEVLRDAESQLHRPNLPGNPIYFGNLEKSLPILLIQAASEILPPRCATPPP
jgi:hypothetical protein